MITFNRMLPPFDLVIPPPFDLVIPPPFDCK